MRKFLALAASLLFLTAWSLPEAADQANKTLVTVGNWCSGTIVSDNKVATANHCLPRVKQNNNRFAKGQPYGYKFYEPLDVTRYIFDKQGNEIGKIVYKAVVYKYDEKHDVAILANVSNVKFAEWARVNTTPVEYGNKIYTIGNPAMWKNVVAEGTVIKPKLPLNLGDGFFDGILFDAAIMGGSSGGGLFNDKGELIGLTNWGFSGTRYMLASPVVNLMRLLNA